MLLDDCMEWLKKTNIQRVKLHAYSWNDSAKCIYERKGFKAYAISYEKWLEEQITVSYEKLKSLDFSSFLYSKHTLYSLKGVEHALDTV